MNNRLFVLRRAALACGAAGLLMALDTSAQHATSDPGEAASACLAIESDQLRLACYDRALGRGRTSTAAADAAAQRARQEVEAAAKATDASAIPGATRGQHSDLYASEPQRAIANAGKFNSFSMVGE